MKTVTLLTSVLIIFASCKKNTPAPNPALNPTITNFSPTSAYANDTITITGTGFSSPNTVTINSIAATVVFENATTIKIKVPINNTATGAITVTNINGTATSTTNFTFLNPYPASTPYVYVAGSEFNGTGYVPKYLINGIGYTITVPISGVNAIKKILYSSTLNYDLAIFSNTNVPIGNLKAFYTVNGNIVSLSSDTSWVNDIVAIGSDVYACGWEKVKNNPIFYTRAVYWKNGVKTVLPNSNNTLGSSADAIAASSNGDVVIAMTESYGGGITNVTKYDNGSINTFATFTSSNFPTITGLDILGANTYVVGYTTDATTKTDAFYYRNDVKIPLSTNVNGSIATGLVVNKNNGEVYISGSENITAKYWKDDLLHNITSYSLTDGTTYSISKGIALSSNGKVYNVGRTVNPLNSKTVNLFWVDLVPQIVDDGTHTTSISLNSIYVQ